ncbi:hypothetical protein GCM10015535_61150 [Streptomyces gelaticus]|uniref:Transposase n=1 Tax=Streptomyces gelaticus TaxID=285446 RepID=A0ABQ2W7X2_9ACTN|nr:hypothetical protein [Streptomyces gelaticus]GGV94866.1 hypothetical protein GCM10015535_61150 [Streptomyces gelaticus]
MRLVKLEQRSAARQYSDDTLPTVPRRRAGGETVEQIQPGLIIPTGRRKRQTSSLSSIYRVLAEHGKRMSKIRCQGLHQAAPDRRTEAEARVITRYDKLAVRCEVTVLVAAINEWL